LLELGARLAQGHQSRIQAELGGGPEWIISALKRDVRELGIRFPMALNQPAFTILAQNRGGEFILPGQKHIPLGLRVRITP
jgi:hypothetical protein